jgi:hypothetical protein
LDVTGFWGKPVEKLRRANLRKQSAQAQRRFLDSARDERLSERRRRLKPQQFFCWNAARLKPRPFKALIKDRVATMGVREMIAISLLVVENI